MFLLSFSIIEYYNVYVEAKQNRLCNTFDEVFCAIS